LHVCSIKKFILNHSHYFWDRPRIYPSTFCKYTQLLSKNGIVCFENKLFKYQNMWNCSEITVDVHHGKLHNLKKVTFQPHGQQNSELRPALKYFWFFFLFGATAPQWARVSSFTRFLDHTQRRTTVSRPPLDDWLARRRDLYLTTHNIHPYPRWDSNPQSEQASGRRPMP
jgi:hypothetical protein